GRVIFGAVGRNGHAWPVRLGGRARRSSVTFGVRKAWHWNDCLEREPADIESTCFRCRQAPNFFPPYGPNRERHGLRNTGAPSASTGVAPSTAVQLCAAWALGSGRCVDKIWRLPKGHSAPSTL